MVQYIHNLINRDRNADETGASAVEYGLLVAGIAALIAVAVFTLGGSLSTLFTDTKTCVAGSSSTTC